MRRACVAALALTSLASVGCPARLPKGQTALDSLSVDGTDEVDDSDLEGAIASTPSDEVLGLFRPWWVDYGIYDPVALEKDLQRIERLYQARGFYEARARAARVVSSGARSVRVQIVVEEGPAVHVARIAAGGVAGLDPKTRSAFAGAFTLGVGDRFDEEKYRESGRKAELALTDAGYAHASVTLAADVDLLEHEAVVHVDVKPGPRCTFGEITIDGLKELPESKVRKILGIEPGERYSTAAMRSAESALFDLGTFDTVDFEPDLAKADTIVPVRVRVTEAKLRRVKAGPGFLLDPLRNDVHVTGSWENRNFLGGMRNFRVELRPMLITRGGFFSIKGFHPGVLATTELREPAFLEGRTTGILGANGGILPDPINDYRVATAMGSIGLDRRFLELVYLGLFYRKAVQFAKPYGESVLPPNVFDATLGYLELLASVDARDDVLEPSRGYFAALSTQYAFGGGKAWGGDFGDVRVQPELRMYGPLRKGLVLAVRFTTGWLLPYDYEVREPARREPTADDPSRFAYESRTRDEPFDKTGAPPAWRAFYSGGALGNRGYPTRYVGLRDCAEKVVSGGLVQDEHGRDCSVVVGGASLWEGSVELRFVITGPLSGVLFVDASDVSRRVFDLRLDYPHLAIGPGLRYKTPVGPIRLDFGVRVRGLQRIGGELDPREEAPQFNLGIKGPFALSFSLGEAF